MEVSQSDHCLLTRSRDSLQILLNVPSVNNQAFASPCLHLAISSSGYQSALIDHQGARVISNSDFRELCRIRKPKVQMLYFSPLENFLVTYEKFSEGANLFLWRIENVMNPTPLYEFTQRQFVKEAWPFIRFTPDEQYMFRQINPTTIHIHQIPQQDYQTLQFDNISFYSLSPTLPVKLAIFKSESRGEQAKASLYSWDGQQTHLISNKMFHKAQDTNILWNNSGTTALFWCQTDQDSTGRNYYGEHSLYLLSDRGAKIVNMQEGPIYDIQWSPKDDVFISISGFMPAVSVMHNLSGNKKYEIARHHRNTIKWNPFGDLYIISGFGNLQGEIEIWSEAGQSLVGNCRRDSTTQCEWAPCGRLFVCATTTPRIRVENGYTIYNYRGEPLFNVNLPGELWEIYWRPMPDQFEPSPIEQARFVQQEKKKFRAPGSTSEFAQAFRAMKGGPQRSEPVKEEEKAGYQSIPGLPPMKIKKKRNRRKKKNEGV